MEFDTFNVAVPSVWNSLPDYLRHPALENETVFVVSERHTVRQNGSKFKRLVIWRSVFLFFCI